MRIEGVAPAQAAGREPRRGRPGAAQSPERFRFSSDGFILDLTEEAMRQTGHGSPRAARRVPAPPESYNEAGKLAYHDPPGRPVQQAPRTGSAAASPPPVSFVAFDGMLRSL